MQIAKLKEIEGLELVTQGISLDGEFKGLYASDLLSWALGHIHEDDYILLTVLNTVNLVAVASVINLKAIIFCEGVTPSEDVISRANDEGLLLFASSKSSIDTATLILKNESLL